MRIGYAFVAIVVFAVELLIALFVHDAVVRPYIGDALAVVLVYLALRIFPLSVRTAVIAALAIACVIEFGQYFHLIDRLGLRDQMWARFLLGGSFDLRDFAAYGLGAAVVALVETVRQKR
ncbi:MAG: DUF2809 domain-containing protein [Asticcacaulis sp.]|nr:DUF2809 domain-containing protein [Asticcacaulis sp.]